MSEPIQYGVEEVAEEGLVAISTFAQLLREAQQAQAKAERELKEANEKVERLETVDLPAAMLALGLQSFKLATGENISIKREIQASITKANEPKVFAWLRAHNNDSIIKRDITAKFGKGEDKLADKILGQLKKLAPDAELNDKQSIHAGTLKAFVREKIELEDRKPEEGEIVDVIPEADKLPRELFGVYIVNRAIVKSK